MSESIYKCDFSKLKFNLYEIMNLPKNCTQRDVKKKYRKLVSKFHPDKNNSVEEDIFNHIVIAYQILSNPVEKNAYDNYISAKFSKSHHEKKTSYDSSEYNSNESYEISKKKYEMKVKELEAKHKIHQVDNTNPLERIKSLKKVRQQVQINYENIVGNDDFNKKFTSRKDSKNTTTNKTGQLIPHNKSSYALINSYNDLYVNDSVISDKYSSLDNAFKLNPEIHYEEKQISTKMTEYERESEYLKNLPENKYLKMQFEDWRK